MLQSSYCPKIKVVHLLSRPEDERERLSIQSLKALDFEYVQHINPPYTGEFPTENVHPWYQSASQYGCFMAHRRAFEEEFTDDVDFLMICECDCLLRLNPSAFKRTVIHFAKIAETKHLACLGIGSTGAAGMSTEGIYICKILTAAHCMLYPKQSKSIILDGFKNLQWSAFDIWISTLLGPKNLMAITERRIAIQASGVSIISGEHKEFNWSPGGIGVVPHI